MLKEGWDVRNVYVIASMRASVSAVLTEQTLGRGMRLPFGAYTDIELLDTLEVVAHERYEDLLKKAGVLNQAFIDYRTRAVLGPMPRGSRWSSRRRRSYPLCLCCQLTDRHPAPPFLRRPTFRLLP
jgi:type III restriction enzyme